MLTGGRTLLALIIIFVLSCSPSQRPSKMMIYYELFWIIYVFSVPCEGLMSGDCVEITDPEVIDRFWAMPQKIPTPVKVQFTQIDSRICVVFYDQNDSIVRKIAIGKNSLMQIDDEIYSWDVQFFKAVLEYMPDDYLRLPASAATSDPADTGYYYLDLDLKTFVRERPGDTVKTGP